MPKKKKASPAPAKIVVTTHAAERMKARNISLNQLTGAIRSPTVREPGNSAYSEKLTRLFPDGRKLVAVVEADDTEIKVITTYWQ
jgi:hypothetical protein